MISFYTKHSIDDGQSKKTLCLIFSKLFRESAVHSLLLSCLGELECFAVVMGYGTDEVHCSIQTARAEPSAVLDSTLSLVCFALSQVAYL